MGSGGAVAKGHVPNVLLTCCCTAAPRGFEKTQEVQRKKCRSWER